MIAPEGAVLISVEPGMAYRSATWMHFSPEAPTTKFIAASPGGGGWGGEAIQTGKGGSRLAADALEYAVEEW